MTLLQIAQQSKACAAEARRHLYMTCDRDQANQWAEAATAWHEAFKDLLRMGKDGNAHHNDAS